MYNFLKKCNKTLIQIVIYSEGSIRALIDRMIKCRKESCDRMTLPSIISKKHDKGNLEEMFFLYYKDMLYTANDILNDIHAAEDVVQEAFIKTFNYFNKNVDKKCHETRGFIVIFIERW
jgi:hypothetical protein